MPALRVGDHAAPGGCSLGKLVVLMLVLLAASGCVRVRRGWLLNLNVSLEWNRIPWRAGPDGHYEIAPPDCVACLHHAPGSHGPRCAAHPRAENPANARGEKLPVLQPPARLHAVPTRPGWPEQAPQAEEVPNSQTEPSDLPPPTPNSSGEAPQTEKQQEPRSSSAETSPQAASWYGRSLARPWVFRTSQAEQSLSRRWVRLQRGQRQVR